MNSLRTGRGWILVAVGCLILLASGTRHSPLIELRKSEQLQDVAPEDTTPLVALTTVAFGGFRGLVADALWIRASKMQEEGQYFELVQLSKWITQLEPRVPEVWSFQAWNLAYNISVLFPEFDDRWRWVNHGIDLLRKQGLTHNPNSTDLHWDIGWMFQHKIGMEFDLAHRLYKQKLREQTKSILPDGKLNKEILSSDVKMALQSTFAMDAAYMLELEEDFGPLDWRLPYTHTLYWSSKGLTYTPETFDDRRLRRMKMQALASLMRGGKLILSEDETSFIKLPRLDLINPVIADYESLISQSPHNSYLKLGYSNFLNDAILMNADYGDLENAYKYYEKLATIEEDFPAGYENFQSYIQYELTRNPAELSYEKVSARVIALLLQSKENPDPIRAQGFRQMAEQLHRLYQESRQGEEHRERTGLLPLDRIDSLVEKSRNS